MLISYAQQGEDVLLRRVLSHSPGFYVDIGANHPSEFSVTKLFYDLGWHGINVEPGAIAELLHQQRPRDVNLQVGISDQEGELTYYEFPEFPGLNTFGAEQAEEHQRAGRRYLEKVVPVMTLAQLCSRHVNETIDFMSIDVEGHEPQVIHGADWSTWRPRCLIVEATRPCTTVLAYEEWEPRLLQHGYLLATFDGLNRYYVREEDRHLLDRFQAPVNVFDDYYPLSHLPPQGQALVLDLTAQLTHLRLHVDWLAGEKERYRKGQLEEQDRGARLQETISELTGKVQVLADLQQRMEALKVRHQEQIELLESERARAREAARRWRGKYQALDQMTVGLEGVVAQAHRKRSESSTTARKLEAQMLELARLVDSLSSTAS
jgi:FkbM family methyltransferase